MESVPYEMRDELVDRYLRELGETVMALHSEHRAAEARYERWNDEAERLITCGTEATAGSEPAFSLVAERRDLAIAVAAEHRRAARRAAAWWADAAASAVAAALDGRRPDPARLAAGDPHLVMDDDVLARLPHVSTHERALADLTLSMAAASQPGDPAGFVDEAYAYIRSLGLRVGEGPGSEPTLQEDGMPEARRCRLWGQAWTKFDLPMPGDSGELVRALAEHGCDAEIVDAIREAASGLDLALGAAVKIAELEQRDDQAAWAEVEALEGRVGDVDEILMAYARTMMESLSAIRTAGRP